MRKWERHIAPVVVHVYVSAFRWDALTAYRKVTESTHALVSTPSTVPEGEANRATQ